MISDRNLDYWAACPFDPGVSLATALLAPTAIYVRACLAAVARGHVKAMAHITGGGFYENIPRVLPDGHGARINGGAWSMPAVFPWLAATGGIAASEMARTFNCGIGMILVVAPAAAAEVCTILASCDQEAVEIGQIETNGAQDRVVIEGLPL